jgi:RNA polymerase sigma-19 factor, ECF subfamily
MAFAYKRVSPPGGAEEDLIRRIRYGDQTGIEELFQTYYDGLCRFVSKLILSDDDVEDLVQDIFVHIWINRQSWNPKASLKKYLFKAAHNQSINFLKQKQRKVPTGNDDIFPSVSSFDPAKQAIDNDILSIVNKSIEKLPSKCKLVFTLNRQEGLSYSEIAIVLNISEKTVENQIMKALKHLRKDLKGLV